MFTYSLQFVLHAVKSYLGTAIMDLFFSIVASELYLILITVIYVALFSLYLSFCNLAAGQDFLPYLVSSETRGLVQTCMIISVA